MHNHIGTVHAIALCNIAELVAGLMVDASTPSGMRWIPKGMQVDYLKKAQGRITARAVLEQAIHSDAGACDLPVEVLLHNPAGELVCRALITCPISPARRH